jgi:hypothetical protein
MFERPVFACAVAILPCRADRRQKRPATAGRLQPVMVLPARQAGALASTFALTCAASCPTSPHAEETWNQSEGRVRLFNVLYEDGSQRSNRRVPSELLGGLEGDEPARAFIVEQDREIAEKSGRTPLAIKSLSRVGAKKK